MTAKQLPWEDHLLERKTNRDLRDIRRTAVAFANSVRPGHTAVILVGEGNDGAVSGVDNPDEQQRKLRQELQKIYPPIAWRQMPYELQGKTCIRIEIDYDGDTPHFAGAAWIRHGSESIEASDAMLQKLIDLRTAVNRELSQWLGKVITVSWSVGQHGATGGPNWGRLDCDLVAVSTYFSTFNIRQNNRQRSEPNGWLTLSWDDENKRPRVFVDPRMSLLV